jgi:O-antigen/teichoic acid export membrane protein
MTDMLDSPAAGGRAIRGSAVRTVGYAVITALGLISAPLVTRHLGVVEFGRYMQVVSLIALVGTVTEAGLGALAVREFAVLDAEARRALLRNLLGIRLVLTVAGTAVAAAFAAVSGYGTDLVAGTALAGVGLLAYVAQGAFAVPLQAGLRLGWVTIGDVLRQIVFVVTLAILVIVGTGVVPLLGAPIAAGLAAAALTAAVVRREAPFVPAFDARTWARLLRETLPLAVAGALYSVYFRVVILVMSLAATGLQVGYFSLSFRVVEVLIALPFLVVGSFMPIFARAGRDDLERFRYGLGRTLEMAIVAGVGLSLVTFVGAPLAMNVLTDDPSSIPVDVLRIQSLSLALAFVNVTYGVAFVSLRRNRDLVVANAIGLLATIAVTFALVPPFEAIGGAWAATIGEAVLLVQYVWRLHAADLDLRSRFTIVPRALVAAGVGLALAEAVPRLPAVPNLLPVVVATLGYVVMVVVVRALPPELTAALRRR